MQLGTIIIERRFRGPPNSANGGYSCGRLAAFIDGPAEVTLRKPPPLETTMAVVAESGNSIALYDGEQLIATAYPREIADDEVAAPTFGQAVAATARTFDASFHKLPMCYVCGPDRAPGDGLRIFCGPVDANDTDWSGVVAAPWIPEPYMADVNGHVSAEFVWASLDCPTAFAVGSPAGFPTILLGRQAVTIRQRPGIGEKCIIAAHRTGRDGRKYFAHATLFGEAATPLAYCHATWIEVDRHIQLGAD
ncbi:MAG: hypothetical protein WD795_03795 [Woeseia sp.]